MVAVQWQLIPLKSISIYEMRTQRNEVLGESDFRVLPDYEKNKDLWIQYRKKLSDLPTIWADGMEFPIPPLNSNCYTI